MPSLKTSEHFSCASAGPAATAARMAKPRRRPFRMLDSPKELSVGDIVRCAVRGAE